MSWLHRWVSFEQVYRIEIRFDNNIFPLNLGIFGDKSPVRLLRYIFLRLQGLSYLRILCLDYIALKL